MKKRAIILSVCMAMIFSTFVSAAENENQPVMQSEPNRQMVIEEEIYESNSENQMEGNESADISEDGFDIRGSILVRYTGTAEKVVIPEGVTGIGENAFSGKASLTEVTTPSSLRTIGFYAFYNCVNLKKIDLHPNVEYIAAGAFRSCSSLEEIIIPQGITVIDDYTFYYCQNLRKVVIPSSVISIGNAAFFNCNSLEELTIPPEVSMIGDSALGGTAWLEKQAEKEPLVIVNGILLDGGMSKGEVVIPEGVVHIADYAFSNNSEVTKISIPETVTCIGDSAFSLCGNLTEINIPSSVKDIGSYAFFRCENLKEIAIHPEVKCFGRTVWIFEYTAWLENERDKNSMVIVNGILIDGKMCSGNVMIPPDVTEIGRNAFLDCGNLAEVTIPSGVTKIGDSSFSGCDSLKRVTILSSVTGIGKFAFSDCSSLEEIDIPSNLTDIQGRCFEGTPWLENERKKNPLVVINGILIDGRMSEGQMDIPSNVTSIGESAFEGCDGLTSVNIPESVAQIGKYAFRTCNNLTAVNIPSSVTNIENSAFGDCVNLTEIYIPSNVTNIGEDVFRGCSSLTVYGEEGSYIQAYTSANAVVFARVQTPTEQPTPEPGETIPPTEEPQKTQNIKAAYSKTLKKQVGSKLTQSFKVAKTKVTFESTNPKAVKINKTSGAITCIGVGKAIIISKAAESSQYKAAVQKVTICVIPKTAGIKSVKSNKKGQVTIKSNTAAQGNDGYQIQYKHNGKTKTVKVPGRKAITKTFKKLKSGKNFKVRIRAYKKSGGTVYYGNYCKWKTLKKVK